MVKGVSTAAILFWHRTWDLDKHCLGYEKLWYGMILISPQCHNAFWTKILRNNHSIIPDRWWSLPGNSAKMHLGILFSLPYCCRALQNPKPRTVQPMKRKLFPGNISLWLHLNMKPPVPLILLALQHNRESILHCKELHLVFYTILRSNEYFANIRSMIFELAI